MPVLSSVSLSVSTPIPLSTISLVSPFSELETRVCPVCTAEEEDWDHYDYECRGVREMNKRVAENVGREHAFTRSEWSLEEGGMERKVKINIAKARWIYHCQRVKMDMRQSKRLNVEILMNKLHRRMTIVSTLMRSETDKQQQQAPSAG